MRAVSWNDGWTVKHLDETGEGTPVRIPHDAMLAEKKSEDAPGGTNTGWYEGYDYLYEKDFIPGDEYKNKKMILEFEGVYHEAEVWINDIKAAFRPYGYTNFYVDVTELFHIGKHNHISGDCQKCQSSQTAVGIQVQGYTALSHYGWEMIYTLR